MKLLSKQTIAVILLMATFALNPFPGPTVANQAAGTAIAQEQKQFTKLVVETPKGKSVYRVELALTPQQRTVGLMFRRSMDSDVGMLFEFDATRTVQMWMKNTYLSLDMVFIEENGRIGHIARNTVPLSLDIISSNGPVRFVLELNAGEAERAGMEPGQILRHPLFKNTSG